MRAVLLDGPGHEASAEEDDGAEGHIDLATVEQVEQSERGSGGNGGQGRFHGVAFDRAYHTHRSKNHGAERQSLCHWTARLGQNLRCHAGPDKRSVFAFPPGCVQRAA